MARAGSRRVPHGFGLLGGLAQATDWSVLERGAAGSRAAYNAAGAFGADLRRTRSLALRGHFVGSVDRVSGEQSGS